MTAIKRAEQIGSSIKWWRLTVLIEPSAWEVSGCGDGGIIVESRLPGGLRPSNI